MPGDILLCFDPTVCNKTITAKMVEDTCVPLPRSVLGTRDSGQVDRGSWILSA